MKPAVFHDHAMVELDEAAAWYQRRKPGLEGEFLSAVEETVRRICERPEAGTPYATTRFRYLPIRRFPYVVFYSGDAEVIRVMAIAHGRRRPDYWKNRGIT